ncbi:L,D-transpeptidase [Leptolyngbya ohadii]|uniref:L,D-transpeptidase n=1 Tax=Leptolyngbya ohadii TaxID=1962290 RepID=UPI000B59C799|nr:L,D-transpeptidase [Leptolyngbya ohadii]
MILSFVTAALLVISDWQLSQTVADTPALPSISTLPPQEEAPFQPVNPGRMGLAAALQSALNPDPIAAQTRLVVQLDLRQVTVYQQDQPIVSYPIAVGREGWETPSGSFRIISMQKDPIWRHPFTGELIFPGVDNPLGSRWIGFWTDGVHQIGFHGTNQEDLIGQAVSHGCIRMRDDDVQSLYSQVAVGTIVEVQP